VVEQILVHARSLTASRHGFVSFIDQSNGDNIVQVSTLMFGRPETETDRNKTIMHRTRDGRYPGLLGQSLDTRSVCVLNTSSRDGALAWPKEYVELENFLSIPVQFGEQLLGQIGMANSEHGYGAQHIEVLQRIAELYALFLQQKKMMQVIEESEDRYSTFVNSNLDMVFLKDADFRYAVVNSQLAEFFGKTLPEVVGRTDYDLMSQAAADACRFSDEEALRQEAVFINEEVIGQRVYETRKFPVTIKNKKVVGGIIRDITAQKAAQEEILKLSKGIEQSPASVVITDIQGNIEYVNAKFCSLTGYALEEVIGKNPRILKSTEDNVTDYAALWNTVLAGEEWRGEFYNRKKSGELYYEWASISPIKNEAGTIIHFIAVKEDITDYKRLQKELIAARDKAEESDRLKSAFLKNISHEIRTPLNGIMGFTELMLDPNNSDDERLQFSYHITLSVNRLIKTVTDIINIATIETGQEVLREKETDLMHVMENVFDELQRTADSKIQVTLRADLQSAEYMILVDETKLTQILSNLTENAVKFTYSGEISLGCRRQGEELFFFVTDTGIGIPAEHHDTIFERFRQVDDSLSRQHEGTGLGLSICKSYVKMMGGKMWVESEPGKGSSFYFTIRFKPVGGSATNTVEALPIVMAPAAKKEKTVLIVEDGEIGFALAREYLSGRNFRIMHAVNGREAVALCLGHPDIDVVLMDIKMPVMDGFEATKLIKANRPDLPIIAQTAYALVGDRDKALHEGCDDYIAKPFKKDELLAKLAQYL
jgi:PAS domain S-box-containing protein